MSIYETHIIQNSLTSLGNAIVDLGESITTSIDNIGNLNTNIALSKSNDKSQGNIANEIDPYGRAGQKKQGRELKNKARKRFSRQGKFRGGRKPPKKHTPGKEHRKYLYLFLRRYSNNESKYWWNLDWLWI